MSLNSKLKKHSTSFNIDLRLFYFFLFFLSISISIFYTIHIKNKIYVLKTNKIPFILKEINSIKNQKVVSKKNKDNLLRNHIKNEAKKNGMIKADYSKNIINWK
tara:strand:- start:176 stop:487 length:312 start_codon:yes stop_codon:yes gene_type:complete